MRLCLSKNLRRVVAFLSGHHLGALVIVLTRHLFGGNGRVIGCFVL
jgi:hypothetical protein